MDLISEVKPDVLCIQENMLSKQTNFNLRYYNGFFKIGHTINLSHGGVTIFIHETISYQKITLNTPLQGTASRINTGRDATMVSIYNSRSHGINQNLLSTLFKQIPKPVILTGDFDSHHQIWGKSVNDNRRCQVLNFINKNQLNILSD